MVPFEIKSTPPPAVDGDHIRFNPPFFKRKRSSVDGPYSWMNNH